MSRARVLAALLAAALAPAASTPASAGTAAGPGVSFTPDSWNFDMISRGEVVEVSLTVSNASGRPVAVSLVPLCDCLSSVPGSATVPAGGEAAFALRYDSRDDTGITRKNFLITTDAPGLEKSYFEMRGTVRADRDLPPEGQPAPGSALPAPDALDVRYYYSPGCRACEEFLGREIPRLEREISRRIVVERRDVLDPEAYEELAAAAAAAGQAIREMPVLVAGSAFLQGEKQIAAGARAALAAMVSQSAPASTAALAPGGAGRSALPAGMSVIAIAAAGLLDGVNPCAFTTIIFLVAVLAVAGRGRREVLVIGALFTLAVFLTYLAVGLGLFAALRAAAAVPVVSRILRWVLVAVLVALAGLSLYDWLAIRRGEPSKMLLQLPSALKRQLHRSIHAQARTAAMAGGALLTGFLVSIFEFACTGQVYLPTLAYLARTRRDASALGLLALYNAFFILPLLVVFAASVRGVTSTRIAALYQARMGAVKVGLAVVFLGLAAFTVWAG